MLMSPDYYGKCTEKEVEKKNEEEEEEEEEATVSLQSSMELDNDTLLFVKIVVSAYHHQENQPLQIGYIQA